MLPPPLSFRIRQVQPLLFRTRHSGEESAFFFSFLFVFPPKFQISGLFAISHPESQSQIPIAFSSRSPNNLSMPRPIRIFRATFVFAILAFAPTDHSYSGQRIALETAVLNWLAALPKPL